MWSTAGVTTIAANTNAVSPSRSPQSSESSMLYATTGFDGSDFLRHACTRGVLYAAAGWNGGATYMKACMESLTRGH